jgi:hypothetical protein
MHSFRFGLGCLYRLWSSVKLQQQRTFKVQVVRAAALLLPHVSVVLMEPFEQLG